MKVFYIGLHPSTVIWIQSKDVTVKATAYLEYFSVASWNLADVLFALVYELHKRNSRGLIRNVLLDSLRKIQWLLSPVCARYFGLLLEIVRSNIDVVDIGDLSKTYEYIKNKGIDLIIVNSWSLLPDQLIRCPKYGAINVHPSKLPAYKGALPTLWALKNRDSSSSVSYMLLNGEVDGGAILAQHDFLISDDDSWFSVESKVDDIVKNTLLDVIIGYVDGTIAPRAQTGKESFTAKYFQYKEVRFNHESARDIVNKVGLYPFIEPYMYCYFVYKNRKILLKQARFGRGNLSPGECRRDGLNLIVGTTRGEIEFHLFQDIKFLDSIRIIVGNPQCL